MEYDTSLFPRSSTVTGEDRNIDAKLAHPEFIGDTRTLN
jgi:hypothetical protein